MAIAELYALTFASGRQYIGITRQGAQRRYRRHQLASEAGADKVVCKAWRKYGAPLLRVLVVGSVEYVTELEPRVIAALRTRFPHGYNMAHGGEIAPAKAAIVAEKISASKKGKRPLQSTLEAAWAASRGSKWTPEQRANTMAARIGRVCAPETRRKISEAQKGKPRPAESVRKMAAAMVGKRHSEETRRKMSATHRARHALKQGV